MSSSSDTKGDSKIAVAAIDLGTRYSGWAFSFVHDYKKDPYKIQTRNWYKSGHAYLKTSTSILIRNDGLTAEAFGFEAEKRYADLIDEERHKQFYFFQQFKMELYNKHDCMSMKLTDVNGATLPALRVFSLAIGYLKDDVLRTCSEQLDQDLIVDDLIWVLTIPAIWTDNNKRFMRAAAVQTGIHTDDLRIALEPEVASIWCRHIPFKVSTGRSYDPDRVTTFSTDDRFLVVDAGGGTVDITVYEVETQDKMVELKGANGGPWGGTRVDAAFRQFLATIFTDDVLTALETTFKDDYDDIMHSFEMFKRDLGGEDTRPLHIKLPVSLIESYGSSTGLKLQDTIAKTENVQMKRDKLIICNETCKSMFSETVDNILRHLKRLFKNEGLLEVHTILMVGGFAESPLLRQRVKRSFPEKRVIVPAEPGTAVLKGAVMFGHESEGFVLARKSNYTYGVAVSEYRELDKYPRARIDVDDAGNEYVNDIFHKLVEIGETCSLDIPTDVLPLNPIESNFCELEIYASEMKDPQFIDDPSCFKIGDVRVDCRDNVGNPRDVEVRMYFGGPEIVVSVVHTRTGVETRTKFSTEISAVM